MKLAIRWGIIALAACAPAPGPGDGGGETAPPPPAAPAPPAAANDAQPDDAQESDSARIARLEREARALARADGCREGAQCRTAPVGSRPCGGPREYVVYCAAATDSAALFAKLAELARAEDEYNRRRGLASTCEFREPPQVGLSGGTCRARAGQAGAEVPQ
ncbi:MAG TPA: hypothetical protein VF746_19820 [Longimicrobium sp.]